MSHHHFANAEHMLARLEPEDRALWQKPSEVLAALQLPDYSAVADLGAGTGYFSVLLAKHLPKGRVVALDAAPAMVQALEQRLQREKLTNMEVQTIAPNGGGDFGPVDMVFTVDAYHHITQRTEYFSRIYSQLHNGGRLVVIDRFYRQEDVDAGKARVAETQVIQELQEAGFLFSEQFTFLPLQYFLVFQKTGSV
ncbi:class I SAM-dependent methyltransferase [Gilvimarinus chinensis]|uniref:class I SAM-dependent methyltransferase n=1 Tax=Gilvimarinus chinensis TaxID=396005 RepID=UPI000377403A|nr:class I SAM-dependent methyltransferase [Gilvimarinus chinensis]